MSHDQSFKALLGYRHECYRSVVIWAAYLGVLGHRDYGNLIETCWYYRLGQGQVGNFSEDTGQRMLGVHILVIRLALQPCEC